MRRDLGLPGGGIGDGDFSGFAVEDELSSAFFEAHLDAGECRRGLDAIDEDGADDDHAGAIGRGRIDVATDGIREGDGDGVTHVLFVRSDDDGRAAEGGATADEDAKLSGRIEGGGLFIKAGRCAGVVVGAGGESEGGEEGEDGFHGFFHLSVFEFGPPKMARKAETAARATMTLLSTVRSEAVMTPMEATRAPATVEEGAVQMFLKRFFMSLLPGVCQ